MKKILILIFITALVFSLTLFGAGASALSAEDNRSLINPVAVAAAGDYVFVAYNVDAGQQSAILCFDVSATPEYCYTHTVTKEIVNLAEVDGKLYVMYSDSVEIYAVGQALQLEETLAIHNALDFTFGNYESADVPYYAVEGERMYALRNGAGTGLDTATEGAQQCLAQDDFLYFLKNGRVFRVDISATPQYNTDDPVNADGIVTATDVSGMFAYTSDERHIALYGDNGAYVLEQTASGFAATRVLVSGSGVKDMCFGSGKIFLLNGANEVEIFTYNAQDKRFVRSEDTIGTDTITIDRQLPTQFTGFTLASSNGYPTNVVYKTTDADTSIAEIMTDYDGQFIILDFDGAEDVPFYYVLIGDKLGWIQKSDGITSPEEDPELTVYDTRISVDVTYKAKFTSLNTVYVYPLPLTDIDHCDSFSQTITEAQEVTLLQQFEETHSDGSVTKWYYVQYGEGKKGFVNSGNVGLFYADASTQQPVDVIGYKKINASLFEAVKIYLTKDMAEDEVIYNAQGEEIKLYSGTLLVAVREEGAATFVEIREKDGSVSYGWIPTNNLIGQHSMTTNAIVGLSVLAVAITLTIVFAVLFVKKKKAAKQEDEEE